MIHGVTMKIIDSLLPILSPNVSTGVLISPYPDQEGNKVHSPHFMELGGSLSHSQQYTTCPYPNQIKSLLCPSHFWQAQFISFLVGLRAYQHPVSNPFPSEYPYHHKWVRLVGKDLKFYAQVSVTCTFFAMNVIFKKGLIYCEKLIGVK